MSDLKAVIQEKYGEAARRASTGEGKAGCCGTSCGCSDPITSDLYGETETAGLPQQAVDASLGCGNPTALIELREGDRYRAFRYDSPNFIGTRDASQVDSMVYYLTRIIRAAQLP